MTDSEINEAVAQKLGWKFCSCMGGPYEKEHRDYMPSMNHEIPNYSSSIAAAWEIAEKGVRFKLSRLTDEWQCQMDEAFCEADTAPMAIALCFLKMHNTDDGTKRTETKES